MGNSLGGVVHNHGNMVAGGAVLAAQNHIPQFFRTADLISEPHVPP